MKLNTKIVMLMMLAVSTATLLFAFQNCSKVSSRFGVVSSNVGPGDSLNTTPPATISPPGGGAPTPGGIATPELLRPIEEAQQSKLQFYSIQDGNPSEDLYIGETVHAVISNVGSEDSWGCTTYLHRESECDNPAVWGKLPNSEWRYVPESESLSLSMSLDWLFQPNITFVSLFHDRKNNIRLRYVGVMKPKKQNLVACSWMAFVFGPSNPPKPSASCTVANAWKTAVNSEGLEYTCSCPGMPNPYENVTRMGRIVGVETDERAYSYYEILTGNPARAPANGGECVVGQNTEGRSSCSGEWLGESPNRYQMCTIWRVLCSE